MARLFFSAVLLAILAGCAKKPVPEVPPSPMTEAWLLAHTKTTPNVEGPGVTIIQPALLQHSYFAEGNATVSTTLAVETAIKERHRPADGSTDRYLLIFSMRADRWGNFKTAVDTEGVYHAVTPYTSNIRRGVYYENVFIRLSKGWLETASREKSTLLLLGTDSEISISLPPVYPKALLHSLRIYRGNGDAPVPSAEDNRSK
jgi:hypothetical protein